MSQLPKIPTNNSGAVCMREGGGEGGGRGEDAPKLKNMLRTNVRLSKDEELLFYILYKIMEIISFSANFFNAASPTVLNM